MKAMASRIAQNISLESGNFPGQEPSFTLAANPFIGLQLPRAPQNGSPINGSQFHAAPVTSPPGFDPATMVDLAAFIAATGGNVTTAIVAADKAIAANEVNAGKSLYFDSGTLTINSTITLSSGISWFANAGSVTLDAAPGVLKMLAMSGAPATNGVSNNISDISIAGLTFQGSPNDTSPDPLICSWYVNNLLFNNDTFKNIGGIGLLLSNTSGSTVTGCTFFNIGNATATIAQPTLARQGLAFSTDSDLSATSGNTVTACTFGSIGLDAISATNQINFTASNNSMLNLNSLGTIWATGTAGGAGVYLSNVSNAVVQGNSITGASGNGIDILQVQTIDIANNVVAGCDSAGIAVAAVNGATLEGNTSINNNQLLNHFLQVGGISIVGDATTPSSHVTLVGNTATDTQAIKTQTYGLQITPGTQITDLSVANNNVLSGNITSSNNLYCSHADITAAEIVPGGTITGVVGGSNTLALLGGGTFSLKTPAAITGFQVLVAQEGQGATAQTIFLAPGVNLTVTVAADTSGDTAPTINITGEVNSDVINLGAGTDTVRMLAGETVNCGVGTALITVTDTSDIVNGGAGDITVRIQTGTMKAKLTGGTGVNTVTLTTPGSFSLAIVNNFEFINLAVGNSAVGVTDNALGVDTLTINAATSGNNSITAAADTTASRGKMLAYVAATGVDTFVGGFENDTVVVAAAAVGADRLTGGSGSNGLWLATAGSVALTAVKNFGAIYLAAGNNTVNVSDAALSGGTVTINAGASGNETITAAADSTASKGKTLAYVAGPGTDSFTSGFESDVVKVSAAAVGADTLIGGKGSNSLWLTTAGTASLAGVSQFGAVYLAAGLNTVSLTDRTLAGGTVTVNAGANAATTINAAGDTSASANKTLAFITGGGAANFTGGYERDVVQITASSVGSVGSFTLGAAGSQVAFQNSAIAAQVIGNFQPTSDIVLLYGSHAAGGFDLGAADNVLDPTTATALDASVFIAGIGGGFTSTNQRLAYDTASGHLYYSATGDSTSESLLATFTGAPGLTANCFRFIF